MSQWAKEFIVIVFLLLTASAFASQRSTVVNNGIFNRSIDGRLYQISVGRQDVQGWPVDIDGVPVSNITACELDDDINSTEYAIFVRSADKYYLYLLTQDGKLIGKPKDIGFAPRSDPVIIKTGEGNILFVSSDDGMVNAFKLDDMSTLEGWPKAAFNDKPASLRAVDVNGDGMEEIIASADNEKIGYRFSGSSWEAFQPGITTEEAIRSPNTYSSLLGPDITVRNKMNGIVTESGPFHHFSQPDDPILYGPTMYFSPNGDGVKDILEVPTALNFDKTTNYGYYILDCAGNIVATLKEGSEVPSGPQTYSWDGGGTRSPTVETYFLVLSAEAYMSDPIFATRKVILDTIPPSIESFDVKNGTFSPNGDGYNDVLEIGLKTSKKCDLHVQFMDKNGKSYHEETVENMSAFPSVYQWDGKGDDGKVVEGSYSYSIYAEDFAGNRSASFEGIVSIDMTPYLMVVGVTPESVNNVRPDIRLIVFNLKVLTPCTLEAYISNSSAVVKTFINTSDYKPGDYVISWEGTNDNGDKLPEGSYNYVFFAQFKDVTSKQTGIVRIDNTSPYLSKVSLTPSEESVGALQSMSGQFSLSFELSETSIVSVDLLDPQGNVLTNLTSGEIMNAGVQTIAYGKEKLEQAGTLEARAYSIRITAVDEAGNIGTDDSATLNILSGFGLSDVSVGPLTFTPNNDNHDDYVTFKYRVTGGENDITSKIVIKSLSGETVRTFAFVNSSGYISQIWDGLNEKGVLCPDGQYNYEISAIDGNGNACASSTGALTLVSNPTIVVYADPKQFSPDNSISGSTTIYYSINYQGKLIEGNSNVAMTIYDSSGDQVFYFADTKSEGNYSKSWDGTNNISGGTVADGTYTLQVISSDPSGTIYSYIANLIVDRGPPSIVDYGPSVPIITPNGDQQQDFTTIRYKVVDASAQVSSVEVKIYDSATTFDAASLVRCLSGDINGDTDWYGDVDVKGGNGDRDCDGCADKGMYKYVIEATDVLGNKMTYISSNEIEVDKVHLSIVPAALTNPSNPYFSPNGDGVKDDTLVYFQLQTSQEANPYYAMSMKKGMKISSLSDYPSGFVTVEVKDASGSIVKTIVSSEPAYCYCDGAKVGYCTTWDGTDSFGSRVKDGTYNIVVYAVDISCDPADNIMSVVCTVDTVAPTVSIESPAEYSWESGVFDISGTVSDETMLDTYSVNNSSGTIGSGTCQKHSEKLCSFDTARLNGETPVWLVATDEAGNTSSVAIRRFNIDNDPPVLVSVSSESSGIGRNYFNPYTDQVITVECNLSDNSFSTSGYPDQGAAHYISVSAEVCLGDTVIQNLSGSTLSADGTANIVWNGENLNGDYVNEGDYVCRINAIDSQGNASSTYEYTISLQDDQQVTDRASLGAYSHDPDLTISGLNLELQFITGEGWGTVTFDEKEHDNGGDTSGGSFYFGIGNSQQVQSQWYWGVGGPAVTVQGEDSADIYDIDGNDGKQYHKNSTPSHSGWEPSQTTYNLTELAPGRYRVYLWADGGQMPIRQLHV